MEKQIVKVNRYNFDRIVGRMKSEYGSIAAGEEDAYTNELVCLEMSLLKLHLTTGISDRQVLSGIKAVLLKIDGYMKDTQYDVSAFTDDSIEQVVSCISSLFDPFTNDEIKERVLAIADKFDLSNKEHLKALFQNTIRALIKITGSIEFWEKKGGNNGYFRFTEEQLSPMINSDSIPKYMIRSI